MTREQVLSEAQPQGAPRERHAGERGPRTALLAYGFRPFFLLAGLHAVLAIPLWATFIMGVTSPVTPLAPLAWHAHEMIYGFVLAAIAGFLLTAVPSWTGQRGFAGAPLLALVLVWLAGRAVVTLPSGLPPAVVAAVDLAFPVSLVIAVAPSLVRSGNRRNWIFVGFLALLFAANLDFHRGGAADTSALMLAVNTVMLMVVLVGGRVVPAFTSARLKQKGLAVRIPGNPLVDRSAIIATVAVLVVDLAAPGGTAAGIVAAVAALALAVRLCRWHGHRTLDEPLLWVLHLGYAWLPLALALKAAWLLGGFAFAAGWLHALTAGAFPLMILAIMTRASLGHTGRPLKAPPAITIAYLLLAAGALVRVFATALAPEAHTLWIGTAALLWTAAFGIFVAVYAPMLLRPRVDGRPG